MKKLTYGLILLGILAWNSCQKDPDEYLAENKSKIFMISAPTSVPADGKSTILITATLSPATADNRTVTFTTSKGTFADNDSVKLTTNAAITNGTLVASAYLRSSVDANDRVLVKVSAPRLDTTLVIKFVTALPDSIHSESTTVIASKNYNNQIPITTYLFRKVGKATTGQTASYRAIKADGTGIGSFIGISPTGSDATGVIKSTFVTRDSVYAGNIRIITSVLGTQKTLLDTVKLLIKP
ncbi:hypothetical protein SAMN05192574_102348 [Mucilaginibacter gossypiicola]|uniref:Uncharacterized protein n=1 Tax=Mucilaginibacter gossypiicola TaxID=551995 RepID=A0A1H8DHG5_9SPHI|nr:hypothetical protein [Mucilaginibacter gossypiicola]SEN06690.1 hypothetical protein SAMN05192574_102348 [Mucilaginibacter gossypiicola]